MIPSTSWRVSPGGVLSQDIVETKLQHFADSESHGFKSLD